MMAANLHVEDTQEPDAAASSSGNGGNGRDGLVHHRLNELELRVGRLEDSISEVQTLCIKIDGKIDSMMSSLASKAYVLWVSILAIVIALFTLLGHALIQWPAA